MRRAVTTTITRGEPLAAEIGAAVREAPVERRDRGHEPALGTVVMSDAASDRRFMDRKQELCGSVGISTKEVDLPPDAPAARCYDAIERLADDDAVTAAGTPGLIDGRMLGEGVAVERNSSGSQNPGRSPDTGEEYELVGDVAFESAKEKASTITPVLAASFHSHRHAPPERRRHCRRGPDGLNRRCHGSSRGDVTSVSGGLSLRR